MKHIGRRRIRQRRSSKVMVMLVVALMARHAIPRRVLAFGGAVLYPHVLSITTRSGASWTTCVSRHVEGGSVVHSHDRRTFASSNNNLVSSPVLRQGHTSSFSRLSRKIHGVARQDGDSCENNPNAASAAKKERRDSSSSNGFHLPSTTSNNPIRHVAAPMVAASDYAFRCLCRQYGHMDLVYTQMLHAKHLVYDKHFARNHLDLYEYHNNHNHEFHPQQLTLLSSQRNLLLVQGCSPMEEQDQVRMMQQLDFHRASKGPVIVQLAGHDVDVVVKAAHFVLEHTQGQLHGIDLNLGCPQNIAKKGRYGAYLMERDPDVVYRILKALRQSLPKHVAVSAKIRLPQQILLLDNIHDDRKRLLLLHDRLQRLVDTGIDFLTIHGRTLDENKINVRAVHKDWLKHAIDYVHEHHDPTFPVIANGGIEFQNDATQLQRDTGASALMSSEALLECPNVFVVDSTQLSPRQLLQQQISIATDYLLWCQFYPPLPGVLGPESGSINIVRGHLFKFLHRYLQEHLDLRQQLASHHLQTSVQARELVHELHQRYVHLSDDELAQLPSSQLQASWYRRHWDAVANNRVRSNSRTTGSDLHVNGDSGRDSESTAPLTIEQRKNLIKQRISDLQRARKQKNGAITPF